MVWEEKKKLLVTGMCGSFVGFLCSRFKTVLE